MKKIDKIQGWWVRVVPGAPALMLSKVLRAGRALCPQSLKKPCAGARGGTILPVPAILDKIKSIESSKYGSATLSTL